MPVASNVVSTDWISAGTADMSGAEITSVNTGIGAGRTATADMYKPPAVHFTLHCTGTPMLTVASTPSSSRPATNPWRSRTALRFFASSRPPAFRPILIGGNMLPSCACRLPPPRLDAAGLTMTDRSDADGTRLVT